MRGPATPVPKQCLKYNANVENKVNLYTFLEGNWCELVVKYLLDGKYIVIGAICWRRQVCPEDSVIITSGHCENLVSLKSDHTKADTKLLVQQKKQVIGDFGRGSSLES